MLLYDTYYKALFHYGISIHRDRDRVKECLHVLFCDLWERRERLPDTVKDPKFYLFIWLKRIILREIKATEASFSGMDMNDKLIEDSPEDSRIEVEKIVERSKRLELALSKLTKKQRRMIELRFYEGKSYDEIAMQEGSATRTVYNVIYEALKTLRNDLYLLFLFILKFI